MTAYQEYHAISGPTTQPPSGRKGAHSVYIVQKKKNTDQNKAERDALPLRESAPFWKLTCFELQVASHFTLLSDDYHFPKAQSFFLSSPFWLRVHFSIHSARHLHRRCTSILTAWSGRHRAETGTREWLPTRISSTSACAPEPLSSSLAPPSFFPLLLSSRSLDLNRQ